MGEWTRVGVNELQDRGVLLVEDGNHGEYRPRSHEFTPVGTAFVRAADMDHGRVRFESIALINDVAMSRIRKGIGRPNDVLLSHKGTVGKVAWVGENPPPFVCSPQTTFYRSIRADKLDPRYLFFHLQSPPFQEQLRSRLGETDMAPYVSLTEQRRLMLTVPPLAEQRAIAEVLGALDDKIEANRRLVELCDTTWRVTLAGESDTQLVPLSYLATFINGRAFTKDASGTGRMVVRIAELNSGPGGSTVYNDMKVVDDYLARPGDLLFAWSGSLTVARWYRPEAIVNQHIFKVVPKPGTPIWLVHAGILGLLDFFRGIAADKATTMGHIQRHHLDEQVVVPTPERIAQLDRWCRPLWQRALAAEQESLTLANLRDTVLPKLLSGDLGVRDAEERVSDAP